MSYNQVFAQESAQRLIKNAWQNKKLASAYLFFGPRGSGRFSLAQSLAKTTNCLAGSFPPCLNCSSCIKTEKGNHPDVHIIGKENSSFIRIEQIHQMQREIFLHPFEGKCKVFIILNAEELTPEAANSLLKILEEPPGDSLIILITSQLSRIFPTIISRCQKVRFHPVDTHQAEVILNRDYHLGKEPSHFLAFVFEGSIGEALKFKHRNILSEKNQIINSFITNPGTLLDDFGSKDRDELNWILKVLISCARDLYLLKIGTDPGELINQDLKDRLLDLADQFSFTDLEQIMWQLANSLENVRQNINPKLLIDNLKILWKK